MCNQVCPVLSQCERLREKNQRAAIKYNKPTFAPKCEPSTGNWQPIQCLEHVGVCWCVSPQGEPLKGTLTRGAEPECNFRQARNKPQSRSDMISDADLVLEELMLQIGNFDDVDEPADLKKEDEMMEESENFINIRCKELGGQCDENGKFLPIQCEEEVCWCVDEAGNQLSQTNTFKKGEKTCSPSPVEKVEVILGFRGEYDDVSAIPVVNQIGRIVRSLKGIIDSDGIQINIADDALYVKFSLIGNQKVDIAYTLEQMVMHQRLPGLTPDLTRSRVTHHLLVENSLNADSFTFEHREIVSQSPVSVVAPYHTALIVIAAASAFIISVLTLLVILYRRKVNNLHTIKVVDENRFLSNNRPIYIELPNEKYSSLSSEKTESA